MIQALWTLPCLIALRVWPGTMTNAWGTFALITVLLSYPYCHAILVYVLSFFSCMAKHRSNISWQMTDTWPGGGRRRTPDLFVRDRFLQHYTTVSILPFIIAIMSVTICFTFTADTIFSMRTTGECYFRQYIPFG